LTGNVELESRISFAWNDERGGVELDVLCSYSINLSKMLYPSRSIEKEVNPWKSDKTWGKRLKQWAGEMEKYLRVYDEICYLERGDKQERFIKDAVEGSEGYATEEDFDDAFDLIASLEQRISELEKQGFLTPKEVEEFEEKTEEAKAKAKRSGSKRGFVSAIMRLLLWIQSWGVVGRKILASDGVATGAKALLPEETHGVIDIVHGTAKALPDESSPKKE
jgi:hypothetical protein